MSTADTGSLIVYMADLTVLVAAVLLTHTDTDLLRPVQPPVNYTTTSTPQRGIRLRTRMSITPAHVCTHAVDKSGVGSKASPF